MATIAAIILAAGQSRRMGQPKMLLPWGKTSVLGQVIDTLIMAGAGEVVVISGGARQAVEAEAKRHSDHAHLRYIFNPEFESGEMLSSFQVGLAALDEKVDAALVGLGDQPQISLEAAQRVVGAYTPGAALIIPSYQMRRGHPWLVGRSLWPSALRLKAPQTMRDFLNACAGQIQYVETDQTVLKDLDTPDDYQREKP